MGRITRRPLWVLGNPYKCASREPVGRTESAIDFGRILRTMDSSSYSFWGSGWQCLGGLPLVFGLSGSTTLNLVASFMDASDNKRRYSGLSMTTTPEPLSGFVMTISSRRFNWLMALRSDLGDLGPLRWM